MSKKGKGKGKPLSEDADRTEEALNMLKDMSPEIREEVLSHCLINQLFSVVSGTTDVGLSTKVLHECKRALLMKRAQEEYKKLKPFLGLHLGLRQRPFPSSPSSPSATAASEIVIVKALWNGEGRSAGLEDGDVLQTFAGRRVRNFQELDSFWHVYKPGDTVNVQVVRRTAAAQDPLMVALSVPVGALGLSQNELGTMQRIARGLVTEQDQLDINPMSLSEGPVLWSGVPRNGKPKPEPVPVLEKEEVEEVKGKKGGKKGKADAKGKNTSKSASVEPEEGTDFYSVTWWAKEGENAQDIEAAQKKRALEELLPKREVNKSPVAVKHLYTNLEDTLQEEFDAIIDQRSLEQAMDDDASPKSDALLYPFEFEDGLTTIVY